MMEKLKNTLFRALAGIALILFSVQSSFSQCAMCKATVENAENSDTFAAGLNAGILYLMSIPYILFGVIAFLWYRNSKKNKVKRERIEQRLKNSISRA